MTLVLNQTNQYTTLEGMSMDQYAKHSNQFQPSGHRRSSIGCNAELRGQNSLYCHRSKILPSSYEKEDSDGEELSECSTIISSLELSASSLFSEKEPKRPSHTLPFPFEEEDESSGRVLKDSILYHYCNAYASHSPLKNDNAKLTVSPSMQKKLRLAGMDQASNDSRISDRRKMMSRWASTGHLCPTDDESEPSGKETRDKPPTSPVRKSRGKVSLPAPGVLPLADKAPPNRRSHFTRRASTGVMGNGKNMVVQLHQKKETFENSMSSLGKNDKAPACPDRRSQFRRRNSTGSSESLEEMVVCDENGKGKSKSSKRTNHSHPAHADPDFVDHSAEGKTTKKNKSKKKSSKEKKDKSEKKEKSKKKERYSSKSLRHLTSSSTKKSSDRRSCLQNESLFSLLGQSTSTLMKQSAQMFEAPAAEQAPMTRPLKTFSRRASTGVLSGEGVVSMPTKTKGGGTTSTPRELLSTSASVAALRAKFECK
uniref:Uncharacterized protein n=1 Tax=Amphora coffeiformis TaxID=265554 RepID=A0A7S3LFH8_9STRA